jgi:Ca-activated chloride channel family protein
VLLGCAAALAAAVAFGLPPGSVSLGAQAPQPQRPAFRTGVDVVSLNVTVTNAEGRYVTDLQAEDFSVYEDGVKQDLTFFDRSNLPIALSLLLDTSASMEDRIRTAQEAAVGFARRVRPQDLGQLVDFNTRVDVAQGFTNSVDELEAAIRKTAAGGSTALYNAVYIALKELKKIQATSAEEIRRQAIVVFSDGEDTSSLVTFEQVLDLAKRSETAIYTIGLRPREDVLGKGFKEADFVMRELAQQTGGRSFFPSKIEELGAIYSQIGDELSSQYMLGYMSKNTRRDGSWRRVVVRVGRPGIAPRTKQGYFAPAPK